MSQISSIVVGVDFTPCSAVALSQAIRLGALAGAKIHPVHVIDTLVATDLQEVLTELQTDITEHLVGDARKAWDEFAAKVKGAGALELDVRVTNRIAGILGLARQASADLLVMGAFGRRKPDVGVGTVATACVRKSMTDVLLVRDTLSGPFRSVVAAVDFSETSALALQRAAQLAALDQAHLHVVHVFDAPWKHLHYKSATAEASPQFQKQFTDALRRRLEAFAQPVREQHASLKLHCAVHDATSDLSGITHFARSMNADLVALGTRGRTNLRDILLGSTAERVLSESRCSVLAVKPSGFTHEVPMTEPPAPPKRLQPRF